MTRGKAPGRSDWPSHHSDAPPSADPRSLRRGILAGAAVLMLGAAALVAGPWSTQLGGTLAMLTWVAAVGFGALAYRGRPPVVLTLTKVALVLGVASLMFAVVLLIVGAQVRQILVGTVTFGTAGSGCTVEFDAQPFPEGVAVYQAAHLSREVGPGETVTLTTWLDDEVYSVETSSSSSQGYDCMGGAAELAGTGAYRVSVTVAQEVLAEGVFEVRPAGE